MHPVALALTPGEPSGIGLDITVQVAQHQQALPFIVYCDDAVLMARARLLGLPLKIHIIEDVTNQLNDTFTALPPGQLYVYRVKCHNVVVPGQTDVANAVYVLNCLDAAANDCLRCPDRLALVTGPIQKSIINDAGIPFSGHTEYLQALAGIDKVVMMLATHSLRVALVTTHMALRQVADAITYDNVCRTIQIIHVAMKRYFTQAAPLILVCGLNPHAGEGGHLGEEECMIIEPALSALRTAGINVVGPVPADTAFTVDRLRGVDVVVSMYHDQGLPVLKAQGFGGAINITLGLPFIRTSVDHGTALDLAGTGRASYDSLQLAMDQAAAMLRRVVVDE